MVALTESKDAGRSGVKPWVDSLQPIDTLNRQQRGHEKNRRCGDLNLP
jgi:hypothetical protein